MLSEPRTIENSRVCISANHSAFWSVASALSTTFKPGSLGHGAGL